MAEGKKPRSVREGDVFLLPLKDGLAAAGVVARKAGGGVILVYLYRGDPTWTQLADIPEGPLDPKDPLFIGITSWKNLRSGDWPILGHLPQWNREDWPQPTFGRAHPDLGWVIVNLKESLVYTEEMRRATAQDVAGLFPGTVHGVGAIANLMHRILTSPEGRYVQETPEQYGHGWQ